VKLGTRSLATLLATVPTSILASCGGDDGALHATLTDSDCTFRGDTTPAAGRFSIELENQTLRFASFGLLALAEGVTVADVELLEERVKARRLGRSRAVPDVPPPFDGWVVGADVEPASRTRLPVDTSAGTYVVVCFVHPNADERRSSEETPRPERAHTAAWLEVTGTPFYGSAPAR